MGGLLRLSAAETERVSLPDLVVVEANEVPSLLQEPAGRLRAFVFDGSERRSVPVQVTPDEELRPLPSGQAALPGGSDTDEPGLEPNDLLLLWFPDGGERIPEDERIGWVEVAAKRRDETRWFYLGLESGGPSKGPKPLVRHQPATGRIRSDGYAAGFSDDGAAVMDHLRIGPAGPNLLDRSKARVHVELALGVGSVTRTEEDVSVRVTRVRTGPLLVVREQEVRGRLLWGIYSDPVRARFLFTPRGFVLPTTIRLPATVRWLLRRVRLRITMDLRDSALGMHFASSVAPDVVDRIDGVGVPTALRNSAAPLEWYLVSGEPAGLLGFFRVRGTEVGTVRLYYRDDRSSDDAPESVPGEIGHHGFLYEADRSELPGEELVIASYGMILDAEEQRNVPKTLDRLLAPIDVTVWP